MRISADLSQEEIDESEELLSRRPGDEAREFAVKITKTRIIRSRKSKKTKEKKRSVKMAVVDFLIMKRTRRVEMITLIQVK